MTALVVVVVVDVDPSIAGSSVEDSSNDQGKYGSDDALDGSGGDGGVAGGRGNGNSNTSRP